ncbi:unnamed protein product, partial [Polarella glacialis]
MVSFKITVAKPKVAGKVKLAAAQTAVTKDIFRRKPFYSFKSSWKMEQFLAGSTRLTRIIQDFKQFELLEFDALTSVCRAIELENEGIRQSWTSALAAISPWKALQLSNVADRVAPEDQRMPSRSATAISARGHYAMRPMPEILDHAAKNNVREALQLSNVADRVAPEDQRMPSRSATAISARGHYAMRPMPKILDHAAKNNVREVREMLEVMGADPNYIHVRKDAWAISDSRLEFYEEITPLVVAAEFGACDVIKVLFNHPQIDVNLSCCAFSDLEIYNYYTAYDMTISKKHPHAAALLRARGVLPASSEHVFKPPFDRVHGRPLRETISQTYEHDDYGEGEMPSWEVGSSPNVDMPDLDDDGFGPAGIVTSPLRWRRPTLEILGLEAKEVLQTLGGTTRAVLTSQVDFFPAKESCQTPARLTWKLPAPLGFSAVCVDKLEMDKAGKFKLEASTDKAVENLQKFMLNVTGEELSNIQARDLLGYLDASSDGRVGMEEFRHFMVPNELQRTDANSFMWHPTKKFRDEQPVSQPWQRSTMTASPAASSKYLATGVPRREEEDPGTGTPRSPK